MANINDPNESMAERALRGNTMVNAARITGDR